MTGIRRLLPFFMRFRWSLAVAMVLAAGVGGLNIFTADASAAGLSANTEPIILLPGRIQAEDYMSGGEGVGYHDTTPGNAGNSYRDDDVDIEPASDSGGGYNIGWVREGEWLSYNVEVDHTGTYEVTARVAARVVEPKRLHVSVDGVDVTGPITFDGTGGWQVWTDTSVSVVTLDAGVHELRVHMDSGLFNLNYVNVVESAREPLRS